MRILKNFISNILDKPVRIKKLPRLIVTKTFEFDSAHYLPHYDGKCRNLHGHRFLLEVAVIGEIYNNSGMVVDFKTIKDIVDREVISKFDHNVINDYIPNPTAENMVIWIWKELENRLKLYHIKLYETPTSYCLLTREEVNS